MRKTLTVRLAATTRTDLVCISCGGFRCEYAVGLATDLVANASAGIHKRCVPTKRRGARIERVDVLVDVPPGSYTESDP